MSIRVVDLRAEYVLDLLGTEKPRPRLSWRIEADERGMVQAAYRIRAADSPEALTKESALVWDSGTVPSDASFDVAYGGPPPASMARIW